MQIELKLMRMYKKGFTLIELLVVIAIIGLLASISLASLNVARMKAADAKIKEQLSQLRSQAEIYYNSQHPPTYTDLFTDATALNLFNTAFATGGDGEYEVCGEGISPYWRAAVRLKTDTAYMWYVDGTGRSEMIHMPPNSAFASCLSIN